MEGPSLEQSRLELRKSIFQCWKDSNAVIEKMKEYSSQGDGVIGGQWDLEISGETIEETEYSFPANLSSIWSHET
ncbi:hypothetical protein Tco_1079067 [Tanacetum coccineum]|uniref:Uncharacterized protein n=1 Tax=Tanacetum coccineum TaxID=301880 RepID=A0ABQ5HSF4_9ASTR